MEQKEDEITGYYIVNSGTSKRWHSAPKQSLICDTEDIAQHLIDENIEYRKRSDMRPSPPMSPISIAEYNKKYVVGGGK